MTLFSPSLPPIFKIFGDDYGHHWVFSEICSWADIQRTMCQFVFCDILQCDTPQCWEPVEWKLKYKITKHHPEYCRICSQTLNTHDTNILSLSHERSFVEAEGEINQRVVAIENWMLKYEMNNSKNKSRKIYLEILFMSCLWNAFTVNSETKHLLSVCGHVYNVLKSWTRDFRSSLAFKQSTCIPGLLSF